MPNSFPFVTLLLLTLAPASSPADEPKKNAADAPKEESVVDYDNKTHGALQVKCIRDEPKEWFDVLQDGKRAFKGNPPLLNKTIELMPGAYMVDVNRTQRKVTVEAGKKTILWTGDLIVEGTPESAYWYPMQGNARRVRGNPPTLNTPRALFPGTYDVHVSVDLKNKDLGEATVKPGLKTTLKH